MEQVKGYMTVVVEEATGRNKKEEYKWDGHEFDGFLKVEIRGGSRNVKAHTSAVKVQGSALVWNEDLVLEVLDGASELRLILCRKKTPGMTGSSVIAACGIYMNDIMDAVPIDKYFELFKPGQGGDGGFIRVSISYSQGPVPPSNPGPSATIAAGAGDLSPDMADEIAKRLAQFEEEDDDDDDGPPRKALMIAGVGAVAALIGGILLAKKR